MEHSNFSESEIQSIRDAIGLALSHLRDSINTRTPSNEIRDLQLRRLEVWQAVAAKLDDRGLAVDCAVLENRYRRLA